MGDLNDLSTRDLWVIVMVLTFLIIGLAFGVVRVCEHFEADYAARCERIATPQAGVAPDLLCANPTTGALSLPPKE